MNSAPPRVVVQWSRVFAGGLLLLAGLLAFAQPSQQRLLSYLAPFVFFTGLSTGSLALLFIPALTGGDWGRHLQPALMAGAKTLPLQAVLALPIVIGVRALYPWAQSAQLEQDTLLQAQSWYLNPTAFVVRSAVYFAVWLALLWRVVRRGPGRVAAPAPGTAAVGLILFALTALFAATDWVMSLMPHWHSSTFGLMLGTGWMLGAAALAVSSTLRSGPLPAEPAHLSGDFGNLLLMFVLAWSYLAFMQYLTVWVADLPVETQWYIPRTLTSWRGVGWFLVVCNFAVPFAILLSRRAKQHRVVLRAVAILLLIAQLVDCLWLVLPSLRPRGLALHWTDLCAWAGMGLLWAATRSSAALESQRG